MAERIKFVQARGARAVILLQTSVTAPQAFSPDGDPTGIPIPVIMIERVMLMHCAPHCVRH